MPNDRTQFEREHPFATSADADVYTKAQQRAAERAREFVSSRGGDNSLERRVRQLEADNRRLVAMIEGASIEHEVTCNEDGTITSTSTLTWGA